MLEKLRVENFLSWVDLDFSPQSTNLIVGANNTGKSNLCKVLQFLSCTSGMELDKCADSIMMPRTGLSNFAYSKPRIEFELTATVPFEQDSPKYKYHLSIDIKSMSPNGPALTVESETLEIDCGKFGATTLMTNERGKVALLHERDFEEGRSNYVQTTAPVDSTMLRRLFDLDTNRRANHFKRYLGSWQFYSLSDESLRRSDYQANSFVLWSNGGNLASAISQSKNSDEKSYRSLLDCLRRVEPELEFINFRGGGVEPHIFMYFVDRSGHEVSAWSASSGTLRYLALSYILIAQPFLKQLPLIVIEEPENGLYVRLLREVLRMSHALEPRPQLIFTSHSPYFIDLFDANLQSVFVATKDEYRSTLNPIDVSRAMRYLADKFSLGELHAREMLK